ncbi:hypothetical protein QA658_17530, partial [Proteus mirabilis]|uniref:hypothetical protein n=1 Tax=Proteus mirabilis TaxID=584 RepID=UPI00256A539D
KYRIINLLNVIKDIKTIDFTPRKNSIVIAKQVYMTSGTPSVNITIGSENIIISSIRNNKIV